MVAATVGAMVGAAVVGIGAVVGVAAVPQALSSMRATIRVVNNE
jgi:hypothetical protein